MQIPPGCEYFAKGTAPPEAEELVAQLAFQYGECYSSYVATEDGWETFFPPGRFGVVRFTRWLGRYAYNSSGLLAPPHLLASLLEEFRRFLELNRLAMLFTCIGRDQLPLFREHGWQLSKSGEEPIVRLAGATWEGKDFEWLRRQENYCRRQGLEVVEIAADPDDADFCQDVLPQLEEVSRQHVEATMHGREMRYFVGRFLPLAMRQRRLFAARNGTQIEAFLICNPCLEGRMWAIEMYRRRSDACRGVVPFAMLQVMRRLKQEGVAYCSLSLIPAVRATKPIGGDHWAARGGCYLLWNHFNWLFDVRGLFHFKSRFRPEMREMYFAAWPRTTLLLMIGFGRVWGLLQLSAWRVLKRLMRFSAKLEPRQTLAEPAFRPDRVIRTLTGRRAEAPPSPPSNSEAQVE